jgi:microcompartment protein CcmK/EutM
MPELIGTRFLIVEPVTDQDIGPNSKGDLKDSSGKALIVADHLGPGMGQVIAFVEGREAANPYWPKDAPVDAYCSLIVDTVDYDPNTKTQQ